MRLGGCISRAMDDALNAVVLAEIRDGFVAIASLALPCYLVIRFLCTRAVESVRQEWRERRPTPHHHGPGASLIFWQTMADVYHGVLLWALVVNVLRAWIYGALGVSWTLSVVLATVAGVMLAIFAVVFMEPLLRYLMLWPVNYNAMFMQRVCQSQNFYVFNRVDKAGSYYWESAMEDATIRDDALLPPQGYTDGSPMEISLAMKAWKISEQSVRNIIRAAGGFFPHNIFIERLLAETSAQDTAATIMQRRNILIARLESYGD